jgi:subtilisin
MTDRPWISVAETAELLRIGTGRGVRVAIIDSGVDHTHSQLKDLTLADDLAIVSDGLQLIARPNHGGDAFGHGTAVASIIHTVAPDAEIGSFRVLDGHNNSRSAIVREGVRQAFDRGYRIINCSFGCGLLNEVLYYKAWVDEAYLKGVHVVAACNNMDFTEPEWPGHFTSAITVNMARTTDDNRFWYKPGNLVEFAARGVDIEVAWLGGGTRTVTGSSFAAPRVAGLLARLLSERPELTPIEAKALLRRVAEPWTRDVLPPNVSYTVDS